MRSWEGVGALMPPGNPGEKGACAGLSSSGPRTEPWVSLGLGKEGAQGGAGVGPGGGGGDWSHEMTECRKEAREGLIHEHERSSERLLCATHGLGAGDSVRNMENPAVPLQDAV